MGEFAIRIEDLGKRYLRAQARRHDTLRDLIADSVCLLRARKEKAAAARHFWAVRDVSFDVRHGESIGVIGLNGAGKSTLLKMLARITEPTAGHAVITGRVGALLEVGTSFQWELTGRENIYLYSAILGMRRDQIRRRFDAIVEFSGVGPFIDLPIKRYSSGMYVRLAFSVAAHLQPDILLLDEVLSVGDITFQRKCMEFAKQLQRSNATLLFVSHNMFSIKTMCSRVIYLRGGRVVFDGPTDAGILMYEEDCRLGAMATDDRPEDWPIVIEKIAMLDSTGQSRSVFDHGERLIIRLDYRSRRLLRRPNFIIAFIRSDGVACCNFSSEVDDYDLEHVNGGGMLELITPPLKLTAELYTIHILVREAGFGKVLCAQIGGMFHVRHDLFDTHFGVFHEAGDWTAASRDASRSEPLHPQNAPAMMIAAGET